MLAACAEPPSPLTATATHFDPAPMPGVQYVRRPYPGAPGTLELPLPPKMPPGTGAVPVSNGPVRGSIVTGLKQSF